MSRSYRNSVHEKCSEFFNDFCREIFCTSGGTGIEQDKVMFLRGFQHVLTDQIEIVLRDGITCWFTTHGFDLRRQDEGIVFKNISGLEFATDRNQFRSGWKNCYFWLPRYFNLLMTRSSDRPKINGSEDMTG